MKFINVILLSIFIASCANQNPDINTSETKVTSPRTDSFPRQYYSPAITLDLQEHRKMLQLLGEGTINKTEYDSLMVEHGRIPSFSLFYEELEAQLPSDSIHREAMYAEWYIQSDSLLSIPIMQLGSIVMVDSTLPAFFALLGKAYARMNDYTMSINNFEALIPLVDGEKAMTVRKYLPSLYRKAGDPQKALSGYLEIKKNDPQEFKSIWGDYFDVCMELSKYDLAQDVLEELQAAGVDSAFQTEHMEKYLDLFWQAKNYEKGIDFISGLNDFGSTTHGPGTALNFAIAGRSFGKAKEIALELYKPFLNKDIFFSFLDFKIDTSFHYNESISPLEFVMYMNPDNPDFQFTYGYVTYGNEMIKASEEREEEKINLGLALLHKSGVDSDFTSFLEGLKSAISSNYENAYKKYDEVGQDHQLYPYSLVNKAYLTEEIDQKLELLKKALPFSEIKESVQEHIGDLLFQNENYASASTWYKTLIDEKSAEPQLMIKYAHTFVKLEKYTKAREIIEDIFIEIQITSATDFIYKWVSMDSDLADAYELQGDLYAAEDSYSNARLAYEKAVEKDLENIELLGKLTAIYKSQNRQSLIDEVETRAKEHLESTEEIDAESYYSIIWKIFRSEYDKPTPNHSKNIELLLQAIKYFPEEPSFYHGVGNEYKQLGQTQTAVNYLRKSIQLSPNRIGALELLVEIYSEKKDYTSAVQLQERVLDLYRTAGINDDYLSSVKRLADLFAEAEQVREGIEVCENALNYLESDSLRANLLIKIGDIYWSIDSLDEAGETYVQSFELLPQRFLAYNTGLAFYFTMAPKYYDLSEKYFTLALGFPDVSDDLKNKAENFIIEIKRKREVKTWPEKLKTLAQSGSKDVQDIAKLLILVTEFDEINDLIIQGNNETEPEKKYLEYTKEWIVKSYTVSPKLYRSQGKIGLFKSQLDQIKSNNASINSILNYWAQAAESTSIAIDLAIEGYYVKKVDYTGQWEKSKAQIQIGRESIYHGMVVLKELASKHDEFKGQGEIVIQASLDYYGEN